MTAVDTQLTVEQGILITVIGQLKVRLLALVQHLSTPNPSSAADRQRPGALVHADILLALRQRLLVHPQRVLPHPAAQLLETTETLILTSKRRLHFIFLFFQINLEMCSASGSQVEADLFGDYDEALAIDRGRTQAVVFGVILGRWRQEDWYLGSPTTQVSSDSAWKRPSWCDSRVDSDCPQTHEPFDVVVLVS
jgi:hypothetical protein